MKRGEAPLRIAMMLDSDGPGGAEMMMFQLSQELRARGDIVVPVLPRDGVGWLGELFRKAGFPCESFWLKRTIDPSAVRRLMALLRKHSIDVVHSHEFTMAVYGAAAAAALDIPHTFTLHGGLTVTQALRRRVALRWAIRRSARAVAVSKSTVERFEKELGLRSRTLTVVHNGVPIVRGNAERVRQEFGCRHGEVVILAVGNLEQNKNHRMILEALVHLQRNGVSTPWKLIIAAGRGGEAYSELEAFIRSERLEARVHIAANRSDIPDLHALADIFVMPSLREGLPLALLEAMVAGKAIVASATGGIPEAIADGREGILVRPGSLEALAQGIAPLLTDSPRRSALGTAARERAGREFTVQRMADRYRRLYAEVSERVS